VLEVSCKTVGLDPVSEVLV
jgi:hypothetical protein